MLSRIIFNFTGKCNLPCSFCYIPFDGSKSDPDDWKDIVTRCKEWHPKIIVFGGGDPFLYQGFRELLRHSWDGDTFIHVDTNALALHPNDIPLIKAFTSQIGLPLDGMEQAHTLMRHNSKHFAVVMNWLESLLSQGVRVKVNTVVSRVNVSDIHKMALLLQSFPISQWCLYQFWPLAVGKKNIQTYALSDEEFLAATLPIKKNFRFTHIDVAPVSARVSSHFFVSHSGVVYTEDKNNPSEYVILGNIFDEDILMKWLEYGDTDAVKLRAIRRIYAKD